MEKFINTYSGGMNKDLSPNKYPNTVYFDLKDFRIITNDEDGLTTGALTNVRGNALSFTFPSGAVYLGHTIIRDYMYLFTTNTGITDPDRIYRIPIGALTEPQNIILLDNYYFLSTQTEPYLSGGVNYVDGLVYKADLSFSINNKIRVIGNYETNNIQKLYWIDGVNALRHLNVVYDSLTNDLENLDSSLLSILPDHKYGSYDLSILKGGLLRTGKVQYSYQLYSVNGTETTFAPASPLINITEASESASIENFYGSDIEQVGNKSVSITVSLEDDYVNFNRVRVVALDYYSVALPPTVRIVGEQDLASDSFTVVDYGYSLGELSLEEFRILRNDIIPNTLETKNNYLLAGNIKEDFFDVDTLYKDSKAADALPDSWMDHLDTRAYRWKYNTTGGTATAMQTVNVGSDPSHVEINLIDPFYVLRCVSPTYLSTSGAWELQFNIYPRSHASSAGVDFLNMVTSSIASLNSYIGIVVNITTYIEVLTSGITGVSYTDSGVGTIGILTIQGSGYRSGFAPTELYRIADGDTIDISAINYGYNYEYTVVGTSADCAVNQDTVSQIIIDDGSGSGPNYSNVPEEDDAINYFNNISNDADTNYAYKYRQIDGTFAPTEAHLGGTGPLISYSFSTAPVILGGSSSASGVYFWNTGTDGYKSKEFYADKVGYARDEVYRFGITFFDLKGRPSFAKWIGDIRMPNWEEYHFMTANFRGAVLHPVFQIDWTALPDGFKNQISGIKIVRVLRKDVDKTIKGMGIINPMYYKSGGVYHSNPYLGSCDDYINSTNPTYVGTDGDIDKQYFNFISPNIAINKEMTTSTSNGFLQVIGNLGNNQTTRFTYNSGTAAENNNNFFYNLSQTIDKVTLNATTVNGLRADTDAFQLISPEPYDSPAYSVSGKITKPSAADFHSSDMMFGYVGTSMLFTTNKEFTNIPTTALDHEELYGIYRIGAGMSIYGGATFENRSVSIYNSCGKFIPVNTVGNLSIYGGDTYINMFWFLYSGIMKETNSSTNNSIQSYLTFPVESPINLSFRRDHLGDQSRMITDRDRYHLTERLSRGLMDYGEYYPSDIGDLYRYNSIFSKEDDSMQYFAKPFDFVSNIIKDVSVTSSDLKFIGEYSDSWLKFRYNNYLELDTKFGPVIRLIHKDNRMLCFQSKGISLLSILERETVQTNNTASLAVGTGGVLSRYDYITTDSGSSMYDSIVNTEAGIYYYDDSNKNIRRLEETPIPLSDIKGIKSYIATKDITDCIGTYDRELREVLFSSTEADEGQLNTLRYSGYFDFFEGFYGFKPSSYIHFDRLLLSSADNNSFYLHHHGDRGVYYDQLTPEVSSLTVIINPAQNKTMALHILEWLTMVTNELGTEQNGTTFTTMQVVNSYQDTGVITLNGLTNIKRRLRTWRMNILRNSTDRGRLRDSYFKVTLTFNNDNNQKMIAHDIISDILPNKIR